MSKIPRMIWDPSISVNIEIIDAQHRKLFATVNQLLDILESGSGDSLPVINDLVQYVSVHFQQEHVVMMNAKYPGFLKHSQEHQKFTEKVEEFLQGYVEGDKDLGLKMVLFLKEWLIDHTATIDMEYAAYLRKNSAKST